MLLRKKKRASISSWSQVGRAAAAAAAPPRQA